MTGCWFDAGPQHTPLRPRISSGVRSGTCSLFGCTFGCTWGHFEPAARRLTALTWPYLARSEGLEPPTF